MSDYPVTSRDFHPAVPMLRNDWPVIPTEPTPVVTEAQHLAAVKLVVGSVGQVMVIGVALYPEMGWLRPGPFITPPPLRAPIDDLVGFRQLVRDASAQDAGSRIKSLQHSAAKFTLPEQALDLIRLGMIDVAKAKGNFVDPNLVIATIKAEDIIDYAFDQIDNMFFAISDMFTSRDRLTPLIATEGGFEPVIISALLEKFEISYLDSQNFANLIYRSVWNYVRSGGSFVGEWGRVDRVGQNLYMILSEESTDTYRDNGTIEFSAD